MQQGKTCGKGHVGFWHSYDPTFAWTGLLPGSWKTGYGHPPSHHFEVCSPWNGSALRWLGLLPKDGPKNKQRKCTSSSCPPTQLCEPSHWGAHPRNWVLLEHFKTGPENTLRDKKGRHAVLPRRVNVASVESGNPSASHAELFGHFSHFSHFSQSIFS